MKRLFLANPRGFCAGVNRAVALAEKALRDNTAPVYCLNEIVHNQNVVYRLKALGMRFVRSVEDTPQGAVLLLSAHGVSPAVRVAAKARGLSMIDATCPFVTKVHQEVRRYAGKGFTIYLIGKRGHDEVVGVSGEAPELVHVIENTREAASVNPADPDKVAVVSQTTLSLEEAEMVLTVLRARFPGLQTPVVSDICHATTDRQNAVKALARHASLIIVLGSGNSSNTLRLVETAKAAGADAILAESEEAVDQLNLDARTTVGLTAGASTPDFLIEQTIDVLQYHGFHLSCLPEGQCQRPFGIRADTPGWNRR